MVLSADQEASRPPSGTFHNRVFYGSGYAGLGYFADTFCVERWTPVVDRDVVDF
jgi:hypothetical protein